MQWQSTILHFLFLFLQAEWYHGNIWHKGIGKFEKKNYIYNEQEVVWSEAVSIV